MQDELVSTGRAAQICGLTPRAIRDRIARHTLAAKRLQGSSHYRLYRSDVEALLEDVNA